MPTWARKAGCPVKNEALGTDYDAAVERAENVLLPAFDSWRTGGQSTGSPGAAPGTLDWVYRRIPLRSALHQARPENQAQPEVGFTWSAAMSSRMADGWAAFGSH